MIFSLETKKNLPLYANLTRYDPMCNLTHCTNVQKNRTMLIPYVTQAISHSPLRFFSFLSLKTLWVVGWWISFFSPKERFVHPPLPMVGVTPSPSRTNGGSGGDGSTTAPPPPPKKISNYDLLQHAFSVLHSFAPQSRNIITFPRDTLYFIFNFRRSLLSARYRS